MGDWRDYYHRIATRSAPAKFVSATAVADYGTSQALVVHPGYPSFPAIEVGDFSLNNRSGSTTVVGLAVRLPNHRWGAGQVTAAGVFTDDTTDAQDPGADDFSMHNRADSGSGFIIYAETRFNVIGIVQGVAGDQTTPVLLLEYWNGTDWVDIVAANYAADTLNPGDTNERLICFAMPGPWVKGGSGTGVRPNHYNLRLRHTTAGAGTVNPAASQIFVGVSVVLSPEVADDGFFTMVPGNLLRGDLMGDALFPVFGVAGADNQVDLAYTFG